MSMNVTTSARTPVTARHRRKSGMTTAWEKKGDVDVQLE
jgi:hypothetical protein